MYNSIFGMFFLLSVIGSASAQDITSRSTIEEQISSNSLTKKSLTNIMSSTAFKATGTTTFSILFWDLYKSTLYSTSGRYPLSSKSESLIFQINYLADISSEDLIDRTIEQWQHLGIEEKRYSNYVRDLSNLWPNISDGDSLALLIQNDKSDFYFNDLYIGTIDDPNFGQLFIDIWLSKNTSQPTLRAELLGGSYYE